MIFTERVHFRSICAGAPLKQQEQQEQHLTHILTYDIILKEFPSGKLQYRLARNRGNIDCLDFALDFGDFFWSKPLGKYLCNSQWFQI